MHVLVVRPCSSRAKSSKVELSFIVISLVRIIVFVTIIRVRLFHSGLIAKQRSTSNFSDRCTTTYLERDFRIRVTRHSSDERGFTSTQMTSVALRYRVIKIVKLEFWVSIERGGEIFFPD